jgi:PBSX family phage terminase large subunit
MVNQKEIKVTPFYHDYVLAQPYKVILQIGGRFSSKSYNSEIEMAANLMSKPNYKLLVIEDLDTGLTKGYYAGLKHKIELFEHDKAYSMIKSPVQITNLLNGNMALFSGYASDQQKKAVKAIDQVTEIVVEEGEWITYDDFIAMLHQLRGGRPQDRRLSILMNPVNPDCFINQMFIESKPDKVLAYFPGTTRPKVFEKNIETTFEYEGQTLTDITKVLVVLSTHHDNPYLTIDQRASIEKLKETDPELYLQLGEARFVKPAGAYFKEFQRHIHVIEPFLIPKEWKRYRVLDYGLDKLACYWIAVDFQGKAYVYKELWESDLIVSKAAERIKEMTLPDENIDTTMAPPDLWNRNRDTGNSTAQIFSDQGIWLYRASNEFMQGCFDLKEWIAPYDSVHEQTGEPIRTANMLIFDNCTHLISSISNIQKDEKDANVYERTKQHELTHSVDALRYFVAGRPHPAKPAQPPKVYNFDFEKPKPSPSGYGEPVKVI